MKKAVIIIALIFSAGFVNAMPGRGGYLGHRFIVGAEGSYAPYYNSINAFFTKYNFQYGGKLGIIVARRTELDLSYNVWTMSNNELFEANFISADRVKGSSFGVSLKTFRKERGGIAPIGKFFDVGLSWANNKFLSGGYHPQSVAGDQDEFNFTSSQLLFHLSYGTQMVFWDRVVANTGIRFGTPLFEFGNTSGEYSRFLMERMRLKEAFSVFYGVGFLF